jgi:hypothetical protein
MVSDEDLEKAIQNNADKITLLLEWNNNTSGERNTKLFNLYGELFTAATGKLMTLMKDEADLFAGNSRTEEDFINEANKNIENLQKLSDRLAHVYKEYLEEQEEEVDDEKAKIIKNGEILALLSEIKQLQEELKATGWRSLKETDDI